MIDFSQLYGRVAIEGVEINFLVQRSRIVPAVLVPEPFVRQPFLRLRGSVFGLLGRTA